jgi:hypothetical protein
MYARMWTTGIDAERLADYRLFAQEEKSLYPDGCLEKIKANDLLHVLPQRRIADRKAVPQPTPRPGTILLRRRPPDGNALRKTQKEPKNL